MSTGTDIIQRALQKVGAHSIVAPADPGTIILGQEILNSMLEEWLSRGIVLGFTPLEVPGDELNEPPDARNGIINNLAVRLAPDFDNGKSVASPRLEINANKDLTRIKALYQRINVPQKIPSSLTPVGAGNTRGVQRRTFFGKDRELEG